MYACYSHDLGRKLYTLLENTVYICMNFHLNCIAMRLCLWLCECHCSRTRSHHRINWRREIICERIESSKHCCVYELLAPLSLFVLVNRMVSFLFDSFDSLLAVHSAGPDSITIYSILNAVRPNRQIATKIEKKNIYRAIRSKTE